MGLVAAAVASVVACTCGFVAGGFLGWRFTKVDGPAQYGRGHLERADRIIGCIRVSELAALDAVARTIVADEEAQLVAAQELGTDISAMAEWSHGWLRMPRGPRRSH